MNIGGEDARHTAIGLEHDLEYNQAAACISRYLSAVIGDPLQQTVAGSLEDLRCTKRVILFTRLGAYRVGLCECGDLRGSEVSSRAGSDEVEEGASALG